MSRKNKIFGISVLAVIFLLSLVGCKTVFQADTVVPGEYPIDTLPQRYTQNENDVDLITEETGVETTSDESATSGYLIDGNCDTIYSSDRETGQDHTESVQLILPEAAYLDRIDLAPAKAEGKTIGFPTKFYIELSLDGREWSIVAARDEYPTPAETKSIRIGAQSARYIRIVAEKLTPENGSYRLSLAGVGAFYDRYTNVGEASAIPMQKYYISSSEGNDGNDGMSAGTPWKTLNRANRMIYSGGNQILLKRGDVFAGQSLLPDGIARTGRILISAYGEGGNPKLSAGNGAVYGIKLTNASGYEIKNIDFENCVAGIGLLNDSEWNDNVTNGISISDCNFVGCGGRVCRAYTVEGAEAEVYAPYAEMEFGGGIVVSVLCGAKQPVGAVRCKDISITGCRMTDCDTGISAKNYNYERKDDGTFAIEEGEGDAALLRRMTVEKCTIDKTRYTAGVSLFGVVESALNGVTVDTTGSVGSEFGTAAIGLTGCEEITVQTCILTGTRLPSGSSNGAGAVLTGCDKITFVNTQITNNEGNAVMLCGNRAYGANKNIVLDGSVLTNNGTNNRGVYAKVFGDDPEHSSGTVKNCEIKLKFEGQGYQTGFTVAGNQTEFYPESVYDSAKDVTRLGLSIESTTNILNPDGMPIAGPGYLGDGALMLVSRNAEFHVSSSRDMEEAARLKSDSERLFRYHSELLNDGELSGNYYYNSGYSSAGYDTPEPIKELCITIKLDKAYEVFGIKLFGSQYASTDTVADSSGYLPVKFKFSLSVDGTGYFVPSYFDKNDLDAGNAPKEKVCEYSDFNNKSAAMTEFEINAERAQYVRIEITGFRKNLAWDAYLTQLAEIQVLGY